MTSAKLPVVWALICVVVVACVSARARSFDEVFDLNHDTGPLRVLHPQQGEILESPNGSHSFSFSVARTGYDIHNLESHVVRLSSVGSHGTDIPVSVVWAAPNAAVTLHSTVNTRSATTTWVLLELLSPDNEPVAEYITHFHYVPSLRYFKKLYNPWMDTENWLLESRTDVPFWMALGSPAFCFASRMLLDSRVWEPVKTNLFTHLLRQQSSDKLVLDVGSNMGWFSLLAASLGHRAIAIEPFSANAAKILMSRSANGFENRLTLHCVAASNTTDEAALFDGGAMNSLNGELAVGAGDPAIKVAEGKEFKEMVPIRRLDDIINEEVFIMKLDVEAHEPQALEGADRLLTEYCIPYIFMEYSASWLEEMGTDPHAMLLGLIDRGYTVTLESDWHDFFASAALHTSFEEYLGSIPHFDTPDTFAVLYDDPERYPKFGPAGDRRAQPQKDLLLVRTDCGPQATAHTEF